MKEDKGKKGDRIKIEGRVTVWQEDEKGNRIYLVKNARNHFVDAGLKGLVSALIGSKFSQYAWSYPPAPRIYLGTDTTTTTTHGMTALASPIGTAPGTPPDSLSGANITNPSTGEWKTSFTAVWLAGSISGTVGEMALYLRPFNNLTPGWSEGGVTKPEAMVSRLSVADGDFTAFTIDTSKSLTVEWELVITYA